MSLECFTFNPQRHYRKTVRKINRALIVSADLYSDPGRANPEIADEAPDADLVSQIDVLQCSNPVDIPSADEIRVASVALINLSNNLHEAADAEHNLKSRDKILKVLGIKLIMTPLYARSTSNET